MKFSVIIILCSVFTIANAQTVDKAQFDKGVDFLNCKAVEFTLKDQSLAKFKEKCNCQEQITYSHLSAFLSEEKIDLTKDLSAEIETLKNNFKDEMTIEDVVTYLTSAVFNEKVKFSKLYSFENKKGRKESPQYKAFKTDLKERLLKNFNIANENQKQNQITELQSRINDLENELVDLRDARSSKKNSAFGLALEIDVISILITLALFIIVFIIAKKRRRHSSPQADSSVSRVPPSPFVDNNYRNDQSDIKRLTKEIDELKSTIHQLGRKLEQRDISPPSVDRSESSNAQLEKLNNSSLYFSTPDTDGSFSENAGHSSYKEGATIYKFRKLSGTQAEFQIDEREPSIKLALQYPDRNIDPVCEAINAFNPRSKTITTVDGGPGLVELIGDKWKVIRKAKIRYDN
jgi:hypothetical protein